ncbi:restriction endonuclease [Apibacter raozihei]|uniref:5-methylcytosine restriction system specificity protein McrC n=1 Tax=Apibacter raozihei TaxID=2500547 RepID=UPI000FE2FC4F|nr:restriction endonuclease [Apibacter raozihei]
MIFLFEQYGYKRSGFYLQHIEENEAIKIIQKLSSLKECGFRKTVSRYKQDALCLNIDYDEKEQHFHFETSYFVGVDWIIPNQQAVYVQPKMNKEEIQVDYLSMLFEAMQEPENFNHLEGLLDIDFDKPYIEIEQKIDILSPFLLIQFIQVLKNIVRKGLKKSYFQVTENFEAKVKGKILVHKTLKTNVLKNKLTKTVCQYEKFGINNEENKILKRAFHFAKYAILSYKGIKEEEIQHIINYINPAFENITDDVNLNKLKIFKPNPMYKEYEHGLKLALLILKRYSYNIQNTALIDKVKTPPYWIDMSKLFELYVFKKLRDIFPKQGELTYHLKTNRQELDFLLNHTDVDGNKLQLVIDAKYKPRYENENISTDDARQISGYARLKSIYENLKVDKNKLIDCLVIYSDTSDIYELKKEKLISIEDKNYQNFYKIGIGLPK